MARRGIAGTALLALGLAVGGHLDSLMTTLENRAAGQASPGADEVSDAIALIRSGEHIGDVARRVMPAVVHIQAVRTESDGRRVEETGSGAIVRSNNVRGLFVITNNHVIRGASAETIDIKTSVGESLHPLRVYRDSESDIAVLQIRDAGHVTGRWGDSDAVGIGHFVLAVGSPFGLSQSVTMGIVSAKGRHDLTLTEDQSVTNQDFMQTDAAINPGNSGGPLIDMEGRIIGINTAIASNSGGNEGIGFSIPCNLVRRIFEQLVTYGRVRRAYLGVELDDRFDFISARRLGLASVRGARIIRVYRSRQTPGTPAARAGLREDDVILEFNGVAVQDENHLINLVSLAEIGQPIRIEVFRGGRRENLQLTLSDREDYRTAADAPNSFLTR